MSAHNLQTFKAHGIELRAVNGELQVRGDLTEAERLWIADHKTEFLELLIPLQPSITRTDVEQCYPDILTLPDGRRVKLSAVLDCAMDASGNDSGDWPDLMNAECLQAFAISLLMTGEIREVRV